MTWLTQEMSELAPAFFTAVTIVPLAPGASGVQLCKANPLRWGLLVALANASSLTADAAGVSPAATVGPGQGLLVEKGQALEFNYRSHPGLVTSAWYASCQAGGPNTLIVIEELAQQ